jgi:hypothetical protein
MSSNNYQFNTHEDETTLICKKLKYCMYLLCVLIFMRIIGLQFIWMFNDLIASLIVYCTYASKGKFMAIFCLINSVMGMVYQVSFGPVEISKYYNYLNQQNKNTLSDNKNNNDNDLNESISSNNNVNLLLVILIINMIYSLVVYTILSIYSYKALNIFSDPFGESVIDQENQPIRNNERRDYGGVHTQHNQANVGNEFVPFRGTGYTLGTNN